MYAYLTVVRYPRWSYWAGLMSMAAFRPALFLNNKIRFYKLLGCGKNGTFSKTPDMRQWCILVTTPTKIRNLNPSCQDYAVLYGRFISVYWRIFQCERWSLILEPIEGH